LRAAARISRIAKVIISFLDQPLIRESRVMTLAPPTDNRGRDPAWFGRWPNWLAFLRRMEFIGGTADHRVMNNLDAEAA